MSSTIYTNIVIVSTETVYVALFCNVLLRGEVQLSEFEQGLLGSIPYCLTLCHVAFACVGLPISKMVHKDIGRLRSLLR